MAESNIQAMESKNEKHQDPGDLTQSWNSREMGSQIGEAQNKSLTHLGSSELLAKQVSKANHVDSVLGAPLKIVEEHPYVTTAIIAGLALAVGARKVFQSSAERVWGAVASGTTAESESSSAAYLRHLVDGSPREFGAMSDSPSLSRTNPLESWSNWNAATHAEPNEWRPRLLSRFLELPASLSESPIALSERPGVLSEFHPFNPFEGEESGRYYVYKLATRILPQAEQGVSAEQMERLHRLRNLQTCFPESSAPGRLRPR